MPIGNNGISDHECPSGGAHDIESSTYVDQCTKCSYEYIYPSILTARPGTRKGYEDYLSERIQAEES
jgi:hypothetical protein